ncbi:hypothetical protein [Nonomuraea endophytica]|uniref:hypothetical protein n=1 Tax=Nonomuraea endophytica TaxID=714136 RepID=UPI0037CA2C6F
MTPTPDVTIPGEIADAFTDAWNGYLADDVGTALSCGETNALADLLTAFGHPNLAATWIHAHSQGDDEGDSHYNPDWSPP